MPEIQLLVTGCKGRMGLAVIEAADQEPNVAVVAKIDLGDSLEEAIGGCNAVIDFTTHTFSSQLIAACVKTGANLIMGTTGHTDAELAEIREASQTIPVVHAPNFSVGVNTLFWLTRKATEILGPGFDLEVVEMHHRHKTDAPSGTARRLAEILTEVRQLSYEDDTRHGRFGDVGARTDAEVGVHALRGGDVVGDHTVVYAGAGERVELTHKAASRQTFARGAVRAAVWLNGKKPGLYDMQDVLELR